MLTILNALLPIGAQKAFTLLHASDTHITFADDRDGSRKTELAARRIRHFPNAAENLVELGKLQKELNCPIAYTGDLIDFVSEKNLEEAKRFTDEHDCFVAAGNHEFSLYVGEAREDEAYRNISLKKVQASFKNDIRMSARVINGVKLIALDNGYYLFDEAQFEFLRRECAEGLPVILLMHTPLYTPHLHDYMLNVKKSECGYLCGTPESEMAAYSEARRAQQTPDKVTKETIEFIKKCPNIRALLTGHIHADVVSPLTETVYQYTVGISTATIISVR